MVWCSMRKKSLKIYTKTGDGGDTGLFGGGRVRKNGVRVEAYGTVDELNSVLGVVRTFMLPDPAGEWLQRVQNDLFSLGADLATPLETKADWVERIAMEAVQALEQAIDFMEDQLPPLKRFILPGGRPAAAHLHVARTVCRRAERIAVELNDEQAINPTAIVYLNRLSDFLFVLARWVNFVAGEGDVLWVPRVPPGDA